MVKLNKSNNIRNKTRLLLLISIIINIYKIDKRIQVKFIWKTIVSLVSLSQGKFGLDYHDCRGQGSIEARTGQRSCLIYTLLSRSFIHVLWTRYRRTVAILYHWPRNERGRDNSRHLSTAFLLKIKFQPACGEPSVFACAPFSLSRNENHQVDLIHARSWIHTFYNQTKSHDWE